MRKSFVFRGFTVLVLFLALLPLNVGANVQARPISELRIQEREDLPYYSSTARSEFPPIRLRIGIFIPALGEALDVSPDLRMTSTAEGTSYYIVQFKGPIQEGWKDSVRNVGGILFDYIPDFAFIVYMDASILQRVAALPEVIWVGPYEPAYKISSDLVNAVGSSDLNVQTFPNQTPEALMSQLSSVGISVREVSQQSTGALLRLTADASRIKDLARIPGVRWIEPFYERVLFNDVARADAMMAAETVWHDLGLYGAGQIVAVSDTGLDTGSLATLHQDFRGVPTGCTGTSRIVATFALGRTNDWSDSCNDPTYGPEGGHGTHVAGSILSNGCQSGSTGLPDYSGSHAGLAPQAGLVFQSVMSSDCGLGGLPGDLTTLYAQAYAAGARIHSNSWGSAVNGQYTVDAYNTDLYSWNHKDYTILFSAGNGGIDPNSNGVVDLDSLGAPGTAKNCITVGATENNRSYGGVNPEHASDPWDEVQCSGNGGGAGWGNCWPTDFPVDPLRSDLLSNNAGGMAAFSSRGPTDDGRTKPDIVAPGTNILSTKSQGTYVGSGWGDGENQYYQFMGGTSMATPLTAGAVALIRDFYNDTEGIATPSSALLKATLVNGATELSPGQYAVPYTEQPTTRPNSVEGWGRVNLRESLLPASPRVLNYVDFTEGLRTGEYDRDTFNMSVTQPFRTTLAWTDYPGALAAAGGLVNDLDLDVTDALGALHYPNNANQRGATQHLFYDTDPWNVIGTRSSRQYAVSFTPTSYPASVETVSFFAYSLNILVQPSYPIDYQVRLYDDDGSGGSPGTLLYGPVTVRATVPGWLSVDVPSRPSITSGSFYASIQPQSDRGYRVTADQAGPSTHSWINNGGWAQYTAYDFNIRSTLVNADYVTAYDRVNNLVGVDINTPVQTGNYTVKVAAYNAPQGPQPYALVTSGAVALTGAQSYRIFAGGDTPLRTFGRTGVQMDFSSGPAGNVTVTMDKSASTHPAPTGRSSLTMNWNVSSAMSGFTTQIVLHYDEEDLPAGMDEATIHAYRWDGSAWEDKGGTVDPAANTVTVVDVTAFSDWGLFGDNPTAVTLASFTATPQSGAILIAWETASELDNVGFNLYRSEMVDGPYVRLNETLIPPQNPGTVLGGVYEWLDTAVRPGATYYYRLEDVDIDGVRTFHEPVSAVANAPLHRVYLPVVLRP